ncbi:MAG: prefoldin subunit alpha [Candidatus Micrarchaeia archaeon]
MATVEEQFEQLAAEASYHQHYAHEIENQMRAIAQVEAEINKTIDALQALKENNLTLFNLGSGIFVKGELKQTNRLLMNVGANIFAETSIEDSIKFLEGKKKELEEAKNDLIKSMEAISNRLKEIDIEARRIMKEQKESE